MNACNSLFITNSEGVKIVFNWEGYRLKIETDLGCKPFQEKIEIEILGSSDSVFSPDSEYGFQRS